MRKWLISCISLFLILILACNQKSEEKVIPRRDLVPLLVDLHIADAIALNHTINQNFGKLDSAILYHVILDKYGYTKEQFAYTLEYYSGDVEKMTEIFDDVFSELSKQSTEVKELYNSTTPASTKQIWKPESRSYRIKGDTISYPDPFEIDIDTTGTFILSVEIKLNPNDESVNPSIVAYFYNKNHDREDDRIYFEKVPIIKTFYTREYTLIQEMNNPDLNGLRITLPYQENDDPDFLKGMDIQDLRVSLLHSTKKTRRK